MILTGKLSLSHDKDDYIIFGKGRNTNLSELLNLMLMEDIKMIVKDMYDGKTLINTEGNLIKDKVSRCYYMYHVGSVNVDEILWNLVGRRLEIELLNVTEEETLHGTQRRYV